jgi:hypothetical protein
MLTIILGNVSQVEANCQRSTAIFKSLACLRVLRDSLLLVLELVPLLAKSPSPVVFTSIVRVIEFSSLAKVFKISRIRIFTARHLPDQREKRVIVIIYCFRTL